MTDADKDEISQLKNQVQELQAELARRDKEKLAGKPVRKGIDFGGTFDGNVGGDYQSGFAE